MTESQIELSKTEDGDECPLCRSGNVEIVVSSRCYWVKCRGECGTSTRQHGQTDEIIRQRWGRGEDYSPPSPVQDALDDEGVQSEHYVPPWAKPIV